MRIKLITVGGTIASIYDNENKEIVSGELSGDDLLKSINLEHLNLDIDVECFKSIPSTHITMEDMLNLSKRIECIADEGWEGIVITHGTDTLEEVAYFLHLTGDVNIPIVIAGSQRSHRDLGYDGTRNLYDAILVARDINSKGVLVVFNQQIYPARYVSKVNSTGLQGFDAPGIGPMGVTYGNKVRYFYNQIPMQKTKLDKLVDSVDLYKMVVGFDPDIIYHAVRKGTRGIVIEGFGIGAVPPDVEDAIKYAIDENVYIIMVTRCHTGGARPLYGKKGGGKSLSRLGVVFEESLTGPQARIKLMVALSLTEDFTEIKKYFEEA